MKDSGFVKITGLNDFSIRQIFDCGQCFRFDEDKEGYISGVAFSKYVRFKQENDVLYIFNITESEYESTWKNFLALDADYGRIKTEILKRFRNDPVMTEAVGYGGGIRILRQDPWECVCSFILSQNNNIPRIKKIISAMSAAYGETISGGYAFPSAEALYGAGIDGLFSLKMGFRAKYIYDLAKRVVTGQLDLEKVKASGTQTAMEMLLEVKGIGIKVASCALLFGFGKTDVFPVDVWIKRVLDKYYPNGFPDAASLGEYAGIAQQYLFYYERYTNLGKRTDSAFG